MKNVGGAYVDESSKVLVSVFCHTFEKLVGTYTCDWGVCTCNWGNRDKGMLWWEGVYGWEGGGTCWYQGLIDSFRSL